MMKSSRSLAAWSLLAAAVAAGCGPSGKKGNDADAEEGTETPEAEGDIDVADEGQDGDGAECGSASDCLGRPWPLPCVGAWACSAGVCEAACDEGCDAPADCEGNVWTEPCFGHWTCEAGTCASACDLLNIARVWAVDDGEKVRQEDLAHWAADSPLNRVWDGARVNLFGGRNEIVAFQLILEAGASAASDVDVTLESLSDGAYEIRNTSDDPTRYVGRFIEIFLEHYVYVDPAERSLNTDLPDAQPEPDEAYAGWLPDQLVPIEAPPGARAHGQGGAPFAIAPASNQGVWFDVYIPRDAPPGTYTGTIRVTENGGTATWVIPVSLEVLPFTLPDETHLRTFFHFPAWIIDKHGVPTNFPESDTPEYFELLGTYMAMAHRHRMNLVDSQMREFEDFRDHLAGYYTGEFYTQDRGYAGPGEGLGDTLYSIGTYDQPANESDLATPESPWDAGCRSGFCPSQEVWQAESDKWVTWLEENTEPGRVLLFKYMADEPNNEGSEAVYEDIRTKADWIRTNPGPGSRLKTFMTSYRDPWTYDYIDIYGQAGPATFWIGYSVVDWVESFDTVYEMREIGKIVGIYNDSRPSYPAGSLLDGPATESRAYAWVSRKYAVDFYFMWETGTWIADKVNPWETLRSYFSQGNGSYFYSGEEVGPDWDIDGDIYPVFEEDSRGVRGPIASIRMKNFRRGQQDYEMLVLAEALGIDVTALLDAIVPAAFNDYHVDFYTDRGCPETPEYPNPDPDCRGWNASAQNQYPTWPEKGYLYEEARRQLADLLHD